MCLLSIFIFSLKKCLFKSPAHFLNKVVSFFYFRLLVCGSYLCICMLSLYQKYHSIDCLFILLISFATWKVLFDVFHLCICSLVSLAWSSVQFNCSVVSKSFWPHEQQHARPPCPSPLPEFIQTHVHWVGDAIQPSHPLSSPSPPSLNLSQHQGIFKWVSSSHQVAKVLEFQLQHQSFQWTPRTDL